MSSLPGRLHSEVAKKLFQSLNDLGWSGMSLADRSAQYSKWLTDPEIGGRLTAFMSADRARVWIKDGPVKEYPRALAGVGRYASFVGDKSSSQFETIVNVALDVSWQVDSSSILIKPLRVIARKDDSECVVTWGPARDLKHLIWASLTAYAAQDHRPWELVVTGTFSHPVSTADRARITRMVERTGATVRFVELS